MSDFLLELLSEEVPARMQAKARNDLARMFAEALDAAGLGHGAIETFSTPRRLALIARDVAEATEAVSEELKGPRTSAPPQALEGFLRKTGLSQDQLEERDGIWFARIDRHGRRAAEVIADAVAQIIADFPWPKSMRWGSGELRWVRPLHSIVAMLGEDIVPIAVDGIETSATTRGHRFHHPGPITIGGASDYAEKLRACRVIVDQDEREAIIREGAAAAAAEAGLELIADEGLVVENAGLTEWPVPLFGRFDPDFLDVPREVIVLTMRTNQKYFACAGADGGLAPAFVCVANIESADGGKAIVEGNRRVLAARLADARFFWEQDLKVPLEDQAKKLDQIVFHQKLGTVADKVERVAKLAEWLATEKIVPNCDPKLARRAAELAKADLVTGMVGEFPELQGVVGGYLAEAQGEPKAVAEAIRDHYKPVGQGDDVPTAPVTVAVSLADKLDSLGRFFAIEELPTGSKDPFALRRASLGVLRSIRANDLEFDILDAIKAALYLGKVDIDANDASSRTWRPIYALHGFFVDRLRQMMKDDGRPFQLVNAVIPEGDVGFSVRASLAACDALSGLIGTGDGKDLLAAYKRAANILKKEEGSWAPDQAGQADVPSEEQALVKALDVAEPKAAKAIDKEEFTAAMAALASLRAPIDAFFDKVTVNAEDPGARARRLALLARFRDAVNQVADFSKIEG